MRFGFACLVKYAIVDARAGQEAKAAHADIANRNVLHISPAYKASLSHTTNDRQAQLPPASEGEMSEFRQLKARFFSICSSSGWRGSLEEALPEGDALKTALNPLLALLPRPQCRLPAAYGLGLALSRLALADMERARVFMRRMMWSLNEESGNLGWGVPEAMGAALAMSPVLARAYSRVFLSYGYETGREDNFLDYAPLRCGVYVGAAMLAGAEYVLNNL